MNTRRNTYAIVSGVILLILGIGVFVATNTSVQEVRVYEVPDTSTRRPVADMEEAPAPYVQAQQETILSNNTDSDWIRSETITDDGCCPDDPALAILSHSEGDDLNPVSPEVIEDARHLKEWQEASALHQEKEDAHQAERAELLKEFQSTMQEWFATLSSADREGIASALDEQYPDMDTNAREMVLNMIYGTEYSSRTGQQITSEMGRLGSKLENLTEKGKVLYSEKPESPTFTHTH